jgi:N-acetylglucosaminyl-diphospho-decaprenol L-rhamnosyltransferase
MSERAGPLVDVVVVSYRSRSELRGCVEPLAGRASLHVVVVDNASDDGSLQVLDDLPVSRIGLPENRGFAGACNAGWHEGSSPYVLFLNPDARIDEQSVLRLAGVLDADPHVAIAAPKIVTEDGSLDLSQRRFPRLRSTYAHALFLHRLFTHAAWASELVRDPSAYERAGSAEWASGACLLVRRSVLEQLGGWDDGFFMYCEDKDLCRRARDAGYDVRYEPAAVARHAGGASAPRSSLAHVLARSRVRYARKHRGRLAAELERGGIALAAFTHILASRGGRSARAGHAAALRAALRPLRVS